MKADETINIQGDVAHLVAAEEAEEQEHLELVKYILESITDLYGNYVNLRNAIIDNAPDLPVSLKELQRLTYAAVRAVVDDDDWPLEDILFDLRARSLRADLVATLCDWHERWGEDEG